VKRLLLIATAALVIAVAACGGSSGGASRSGASGKVTRDTLVIGISRKLTSLDPANGGSLDGDASIQRAVFSGLTNYTPQQTLEGDLAKSWTQDSDTKWTFKLRPGVVFSDGSPLTAADVKFTFDRLLDPKTELKSASTVQGFVDSVQAPDDTTVVINTKGPFIDLPDRLAALFIVSKRYAEAHPGADATLGSGPYVLKSVNLESGASLVRNDRYYGRRPSWKTVEYKVVETETARVQAAQAGIIDVAIQYEPVSLKLFKNSRDYTTGAQWSSWNNTLRINEHIKPLNDVRVRQALNYAIDKQGLIRDILGVDVKPLAGQTISAPYDKVNPGLSAYPYDPAKAKQLLAQAGYAKGFSLELALTTGTYVAQDPAAQVIAKQLGAVGIKLKVTNQSFPNWVERTYSDTDAPALYYIGYSSGYRAPAERLRIYATANAQTHQDPPDKTYDKLVGALTVAKTPAQQQGIVNQATAHFREQAHAVFLWQQPLTWVIRKDLKWTPRPEHWLDPQEIEPTSAGAS
jgi:peptide/nickel transport system substrate-binding protein